MAENRLGGIMANRACAASERALVISAFKEGLAVAAIARQIGRKPGSVEWLLKKAGLKRADHKPLIDDAPDEARAADRSQSFRRKDLAFQRAMRRAVAQGREHPPMIGMFKDAR